MAPKNILKIKETKKEPDIEWNNKNITAYTDLGLEIPENVNMFERRFLAQVDITKGDIERTVTAMYRLRAPDYLALEKDKDKISRYHQDANLFFIWSAGKENPGEAFH